MSIFLNLKLNLKITNWGLKVCVIALFDMIIIFKQYFGIHIGSFSVCIHLSDTYLPTSLFSMFFNKFKYIFWNSASQTLMGIWITGDLIKIQFLFRGSGVGPEILHFYQAAADADIAGSRNFEKQDHKQ